LLARARKQVALKIGCRLTHLHEQVGMKRAILWFALTEAKMTDQVLDRARSKLVRAPRVLVADDSPEQRWTLRLALSMMGFEVAEAADGRELFWTLEGLTRHGDSDPELVIADVYMPTYSGLDVLAAWTDAASHRGLIVITAFPDEALARRVAALGATLLPKPFTLAALSSAVRQALTRARGAPC
jgi:DNA-binding response OmpR family regulator